MAFLMKCVRLSVNDLIPLKPISYAAIHSKKYRQILSSLRVVGAVEFPVVRPISKQKGRYNILDGHLVIEAYKELGIFEVDCLVATNDDTYTYNKRVNRLAQVQEHKMILRAIDKGVPEEKLAEALGLSISSIRRRIALVTGICSEAVERLKDHHCAAGVFSLLKKMKPARQIEASALMIGQSNFSVPFVRSILVATSEQDLVGDRIPRPHRPATAASLIQMEQELNGLKARIKAVDKAYGPDILQLTVIKAYLTSLLGKAAIVKWLARNRPVYLEEFQKMVELPGLPGRLR